MLLQCVNYFLKNNLDDPKQTNEGFSKLQRLLFLAQLISITKNNKLLFKEQFNAFANGVEIPNLKKFYFTDLKNDSENLTFEELEVLELTKEIYGNENAEELTNMVCNFQCWKKYFNKAFKDSKNISLIPNEELWTETNKIKDVLEVHCLLNRKL